MAKPEKEGMPINRKDFLGSLALFASVPPPKLEKWADNLSERRYDKGHSLYWQGDSAEGLYLIQSGTVKVVKCNQEGDEFVVDFFGAGGFVGCCSLIGNERFPCTASTVEPTVVLRVPRGKFFKLMTDFPQVTIVFLGEVTRRLRQAHNSLQSLALDIAEMRVALTLLDIGKRFGIPQNGYLLLPTRLTRLEDIANMVGCTFETVSRTLTRLYEAGWLERRRRQLVLKNYKALYHSIAESSFL
ncbi:Crp/Fnr family transcriptional regulator [Candidatus Poribacteria bacterium]|nr:Crp/Fnr family transcriptional regulator [Candidatus Poribacteria bacterium]